MQQDDFKRQRHAQLQIPCAHTWHDAMEPAGLEVERRVAEGLRAPLLAGAERAEVLGRPRYAVCPKLDLHSRRGAAQRLERVVIRGEGHARDLQPDARVGGGGGEAAEHARAQAEGRLAQRQAARAELLPNPRRAAAR
eukprot:1012649-Pleurochrysis_carterae.AAC.1